MAGSSRQGQAGPQGLSGRAEKGEAQAGGPALESMSCAREKEAYVAGSFSAHPATRGAAPRGLEYMAESTANGSCPS